MVRKAGFAFAGLGLLLISWVAVTLVWGDPFTSLYTRHEQHVLSRQLDRVDRQWAAKAAAPARVSPLAAREESARVLRARAAAFARSARDGRPIGRIVIPRIHLRMVVVQGTTESDLEKGPGHYDATSGVDTAFPGAGGVVAIAGHRTTFLHPFRHIDALEPGDAIYLEMPYGVFRYVVYYHKVVLSNDWTILRPRPYEKLVLSACHPLYSASHRWVVFAHLVGWSRHPV